MEKGFNFYEAASQEKKLFTILVEEAEGRTKGRDSMKRTGPGTGKTVWCKEVIEGVVFWGLGVVQAEKKGTF